MPKFLEACNPALEIQDRSRSLVFLATTIAATMTAIGIKPAATQDYHLLTNHFLDAIWDRTDEEDQSSTSGTLPITLVSVFCSIVSRLPAKYNIQARPVGFPGTVLAAIARADEALGEEDWVYINVYAGGKVTKDADLAVMLQQQGLSPDSMWRHPPPAHAAEMVGAFSCPCLDFVKVLRLIE